MESDDENISQFSDNDILEVVSNSGSELSDAPEQSDIEEAVVGDMVTSTFVSEDNPNVLDAKLATHEAADETPIINDNIEMEFVHGIKVNYLKNPRNISRWRPREFMEIMARKNPPKFLCEIHKPTCKPFFDFDLVFDREFKDVNVVPDNVPTQEELNFIADDLKKAIASMFDNDPEYYDIWVGWRKPSWVSKKLTYIYKVSFRFWVSGLITNDTQLKAAVNNFQWDVSSWPQYAVEALERDKNGRLKIFDPAVYSHRQKLNCMNCYKEETDMRKLEPFGEEGTVLDYVASYFLETDEEAQYKVNNVPDCALEKTTKSSLDYRVEKDSVPEVDQFLNSKFQLSPGTQWKVIEKNEDGAIKYQLVPNHTKCLVSPNYNHEKPQSAILLQSRMSRKDVGCLNCLGKHGQRKLTDKEIRGIYIYLKKYLFEAFEPGVFDHRIANHLLESKTLADASVVPTAPMKLEWKVLDQYERDDYFNEYTRDLIKSQESYLYTGKAGTGKTIHLYDIYKYCLRCGLKPVYTSLSNLKSHTPTDLKTQTLCSLITAFRKGGCDINVVLIDEISLISGSYLNDLISIKHVNPHIVFIAVGQFQGQLPPVEPNTHKTTDYEHNDAMIKLFDSNYLITHKIYRNQEPRYEKFIDSIEKYGIDFDQPEVFSNLRVIEDPMALYDNKLLFVTYTDLRTACLNAFMMDQLAPNSEFIEIKATKKTPLMKIYATIPLISITNQKLSTGFKIYNGSLFIVESIDKENNLILLRPKRLIEEFNAFSRQNEFGQDFIKNIETVNRLKELTDKIEKGSCYLPIDLLQNNFRPAYSITCHKLQGETVENYSSLILTNFAEYEHLSDQTMQALQYVACSRNRSLYDLYYLDNEKMKAIENEYKTRFINPNWNRDLQAAFKRHKISDVTYEEFKANFDLQGYSFKTYGLRWVLDHKNPQATENPDCTVMANFQPMEWTANSVKNDKLPI